VSWETHRTAKLRGRSVGLLADACIVGTP
jgi:hypothetical protein